jgi:hypothetical protein
MSPFRASLATMLSLVPVLLTARLEVGEGILWRSRIERTDFLIHVADPVSGQVAVQDRLHVGAGAGFFVAGHRSVTG